MTDEQKINCIYRTVNEILYSIKYHDSIKSSFLPESLSLSLSGGAIDYSGAYVLYRVLNELKPKCILELGLGQSTKIISSYVLREHNMKNKVKHLCVEHDESWIDFFINNNDISSETDIVRLEVELRDCCINEKHSNTYVYKDFARKLSDIKYDFIVIDGPYGWNNPIFSRIDCLSLIPDNIQDSFCIFLHDVLRYGENNTFDLLKSRFADNKIEFCATKYENTGIIVSKDNRFLCTM